MVFNGFPFIKFGCCSRPVFSEISGRSRREFESWVDRMTSLLEPLLILVMGGIVGGVVVVMLLSIVSVNEVGF